MLRSKLSHSLIAVDRQVLRASPHFLSVTDADNEVISTQQVIGEKKRTHLYLKTDQDTRYPRLDR